MKEFNQLVESGRLNVESVKSYKKADFEKQFKGRLKDAGAVWEAAQKYKVEEVEKEG